ncbi:MAG TPA: VWA domain-containing protein [Blastocatellia bacterium]|nr:VWA domain-containing protein [Blastocatellia bacterium]
MRFHLLLLTVLSALSLTTYSQPTLSDTFAIKPGQAVYIITVKGECSFKPTPGWTLANNQLVLVPRLPSNNTSRPHLQRTEAPEGVREFASKEFAQRKTFTVVDTLEKADFVFHVCAQYTDDTVPLQMMSEKKWANALNFVCGRVIPATVLRAGADINVALAAAMWTGILPDPAANKNIPRSRNTITLINGVPLVALPTPNSFAEIIKNFHRDFMQLPPVQVPTPDSAQREAEPKRPELANKPDAEPQEKRRPSLTNAQNKPAEESEKPSEQKDEPLKIDTTLIYVPVRVMDRDGKYIPDLQAKDFKIYEDGVEQEIEHFSAVDDPFNVVLLLDVSGSTRFKIEDIQDAAVTFTEQLRPQDRVMVVSFDQKVWVDCEFTNDRTKLLKAILRTRTGSSTSVYDAVDLVLTERLNKVQGRKAIVLFSDGVDTASHQATLQSTIERVEESNSIVYSVHYDTRDAVVSAVPTAPNVIIPGTTEADYQRAEKYLLELANRSGGRFYEAATIGDAKEAFASIAEELRRQYGLGYYSKNDKNDGTFRKIRVQGANAHWAVRSRARYRAPKK